METIFALASAPGRAGIAVVRVSGPQVWLVADTVCRGLPAPRQAKLAKIRNSTGEYLDEALVLYFKSPSSFTGEDVLELHLHGSVAVVDAVLDALAEVEGCRMASPGEFTRRALLNGKMDITQVEGLGDLLEAETEVQRRQAQSLNSGSLAEFVRDIRNKLVRAAALLATVIDFSDEDLPENISREILDLFTECSGLLREQIDGYKYAERVRSGFEVAIIGKPNVGKSTLLNAIARRDAAITSEIAGTTRDVIEVKMDLVGLPVTLLDTAGLRESTDTIELEGISRAVKRARDADLRVVLVESGERPVVDIGEDDLIVQAKADENDGADLAVSGKTGQGVDQLVSVIANKLSQRVSFAGLASHERHRRALKNAEQFLQAAGLNMDLGDEGCDLAAEDIRSALAQLDVLIGRVDVENLLDVVFSSFCLGK